MARSVVVVATSDKPALIRNKCAKTATAVAEYFRDQGKDVLLMMDSMTRFSQAQREIGLASGEPPVTRGYPPSVYAQMPKLLERAGTNEKGSITGLYTVLVDGDDFNEPITDTARGILDGHIVLDRKLGHKNHYPAIDILQSISRVMNSIVTKEHKALAGKLKQVLATYSEAEDLINIGAYKNGSNPDIDYAIRKNKEVNEFLCQDTEEKFAFDEEVELLKRCLTTDQWTEVLNGKFVYRMQNILNIKQKLETQAKMTYSLANQKYLEQQKILQEYMVRRVGYEQHWKKLMQGNLNLQEVEHARADVNAMKTIVRRQMVEVHKAEKELEDARNRLKTVMQERKVQEKLREKAFEEFKQELAEAETKEIDELVSYTYNKGEQGE